MINYIIRRVLWAIPVLLIISLVTFSLAHVIPGGPFDKEKPLPAEIIANLEAYYGLDDPLWKQYTDYLWNALHGDFGPSYSSRSRSIGNFSCNCSNGSRNSLRNDICFKTEYFY